jgi:hypothetical protein
MSAGEHEVVTGIDNLLSGGESFSAFLTHPNFHFAKADICESGTIRLELCPDWPHPSSDW